MNRVHQLEQCPNFASCVSRAEITSHARANIRCLADIQHVALRINKQIDTRPARQIDSQLQLRRLRVRADLGHCRKVIQIKNAKTRSALN